MTLRLEQTENMIERQPCTRCSALILPATAANTGGICMPCFKQAAGLTYNRPQPPKHKKPVRSLEPIASINTETLRTLKTESAGCDSPELTVTLGPGIVRYLDPRDLVADSGQVAIAEIKSFGREPTIKFPTPILQNFLPRNFGLPDEIKYWGCNFKYNEFPPLFEDRPSPLILRDVAEIVAAYCKSPFPSAAYWVFHQYTESESLVIKEFLQSWLREALGNNDLIASYSGSAEHIVLNCGYTYVFTRSPYVLKRREAIDRAAQILRQEEERIREDELALRLDDAIKQSAYEVFTYLMEDTRNGLIKIGKSKNPERREKTLQSEAPTVELRIAVPTASDFEYELHSNFAHLRRRGEWFELSGSDLKSVVEQLLSHGDPARAITSHDWLGRMFLSSFGGSNPQ